MNNNDNIETIINNKDPRCAICLIENPKRFLYSKEHNVLLFSQSGIDEMSLEIINSLKNYCINCLEDAIINSQEDK